MNLRGRCGLFREQLADRREHEATFLQREARKSIDRQDGKRDRADASDEELSSAEVESIGISRGDVDEEVVEHGRVQPGTEELTEGRESRADRGLRSEESGIEEREDSDEDDTGRRECEEGDHE